jgi:hypothetical protein
VKNIACVLALCTAVGISPTFAQGPTDASDADSPAEQARPLVSYERVELRDIKTLTKVHDKVLAKLKTELKLKLDEPMARWNAEGGLPGSSGTLAIEITITDMKFVSGGKRFLIGGMAGGSRAAGLVRLIDGESGQVLASQGFHEASNGRQGGWTMGATDNLMLDRLAATMGTWVIGQRDGGAVPAASN